jgi:hypothetical protein
MTARVISVEFAAADAAYNTWREQINLRREPLQRQDPEVRQRWLKVAAAACAVPLIHKESHTTGSKQHTITRFQEPPPDPPEAEDREAAE